MIILQSRGENFVMSAVRAVLLYHSVMDIGADCSVVRTG